jgi:L-iditol 2-dehydrogenase
VCTAVAKAFGASVVVTTDVMEDRLATARQMGADHTLNVGPFGRDESSASRVAEALRALESSTNDGFDAVFECCGITQVTNSALAAARSGGTVVCIGMRDATMKLDVLAANCREVDVRGIFRYVNCYPTAIDLIASGRVNVRPLITHTFSLEDYDEAFATAKSGKGIKVMFELDYE